MLKGAGSVVLFLFLLLLPVYSWSQEIYRKNLVRNPFAAPSVVVKRKIEVSKPKVASKKIVPSSPLQKFDVRSFTVKGIVKSDTGNYALVVAPDGGIYIVKEGMYMGNQGEVVKKIEDGGIVLVRGKEKIVLKLSGD